MTRRPSEVLTRRRGYRQMALISKLKASSGGGGSISRRRRRRSLRQCQRRVIIIETGSGQPADVIGCGAGHVSAAVAQTVSAGTACDQDFIDPATLLRRLFQQAVKLIYSGVTADGSALLSSEVWLPDMDHLQRY